MYSLKEVDAHLTMRLRNGEAALVTKALKVAKMQQRLESYARGISPDIHHARREGSCSLHLANLKTDEVNNDAAMLLSELQKLAEEMDDVMITRRKSLFAFFKQKKTQTPSCFLFKEQPFLLGIVSLLSWLRYDDADVSTLLQELEQQSKQLVNTVTFAPTDLIE